MYEGEGPSVSSESAILASKAVAAGNNGTITDSEGQGGVAGSSIPAQDWLASVDGTAAALGILTSVGHLMGVVFHGIVLYFVVRLFRSHFRSDRPLFRHTSKASGLLFIWLVGFSLGGFYLAVQGKFRQSIVSTLTQEGFRCQVHSCAFVRQVYQESSEERAHNTKHANQGLGANAFALAILCELPPAMSPR